MAPVVVTWLSVRRSSLGVPLPGKKRLPAPSTRGSIISPVVFRILRGAADELKMPYTLQAAGRDTSTDADAIHVAAQGIATALVSVPNRYMHSPNELVSLEDVDRAATLIAEACRRVDEQTDFTAR